MSLDAIQQYARSIADTLKLVSEVEGKSDAESMKKRRELVSYILKLTYSIQKAVDEEREVI